MAGGPARRGRMAGAVPSAAEAAARRPPAHCLAGAAGARKEFVLALAPQAPAERVSPGLQPSGAPLAWKAEVQAGCRIKAAAAPA